MGTRELTVVTGRPSRRPRTGEERRMQAKIGDRIIVRGHQVGQPDHEGVVIEIRGQHGEPPYLVRWGGTDHETLFFPGPDALVEPGDRP
jgi:hypothetical protein